MIKAKKNVEILNQMYKALVRSLVIVTSFTTYLQY